MRKIIFQMLVSYDGPYNRKNRNNRRSRNIGWVNADYGFNRYIDDFLDSVDISTTAQETHAPSEGTLTVEWNESLVVKEIILDEMLSIKKLPYLDVAVFSNLDSTLLFVENNLIDEVMIMINPILLGNGKILSQDITYG